MGPWLRSWDLCYTFLVEGFISVMLVYFYAMNVGLYICWWTNYLIRNLFIFKFLFICKVEFHVWWEWVMLIRFIIIDDFDDIIVLFSGEAICCSTLMYKISWLSIISWFGGSFLLPWTGMSWVVGIEWIWDFRIEWRSFLVIQCWWRFGWWWLLLFFWHAWFVGDREAMVGVVLIAWGVIWVLFKGRLH